MKITMFTSRKKIRKYIETIIEDNKLLKKTQQEVTMYNEELADKLEELMKKYPINIGDTLYEVCLRNDKGRFTKTKPSKEHSFIEATVVDTKNYFKLAEKFNNEEIFTTEKAAKKHLDSLCNN